MNDSSGTVSVIDGASNTVAATVSVGSDPLAVAVNAVTGQVYVANESSGTVSVIDGQGTQGVPIGIIAQASATVAMTSPFRLCIRSSGSLTSGPIKMRRSN